jgi:hypothetical protein
MKSDKNNGYFTWRLMHIFLYLAELFLEWEMLETKFLEEIKTHFIFNNFFFENRAFYEIMWKNKVQPDRPQVTI